MAEDDQKAYFLELPDHIIVYIFLKLPIKALIQCRFVCKSWRHSLSDPQFSKQLSLQSPTYFLLSKKWDRNFLVDLDSPNDTVIEVSSAARPVASCNGFVLGMYQTKGYKLVISNPITCEFLDLPCHPKKFGGIFGFGFSLISNVYKVVLFSSEESKTNSREVLVLNVGSSIWRSIGNIADRLVTEQGIYVNGFLHWFGFSNNGRLVIHTFDLETECFTVLPIPPGYLDSNLNTIKLGVWESCLSIHVLSGASINVWVMKDYGDEDSWTKELEIRDSVRLLTVTTSFTQVLKCTKQGQVLLLHWFELFTYTPGTSRLVKLSVDRIPSAVGAHIHIPSFLSLRDIVRH